MQLARHLVTEGVLYSCRRHNEHRPALRECRTPPLPDWKPADDPDEDERPGNGLHSAPEPQVWSVSLAKTHASTDMGTSACFGWSMSDNMCQLTTVGAVLQIDSIFGVWSGLNGSSRSAGTAPFTKNIIVSVANLHCSQCWQRERSYSVFWPFVTRVGILCPQAPARMSHADKIGEPVSKEEARYIMNCVYDIIQAQVRSTRKACWVGNAQIWVQITGTDGYLVCRILAASL